jgi:heptosyltransferase II
VALRLDPISLYGRTNSPPGADTWPSPDRVRSAICMLAPNNKTLAAQLVESQLSPSDSGSDGTGDPIVVFGLPSIGDFVRCHTLVRLLRELHPGRPIDIVGRMPGVEIAALMEGVRAGIVEPFAPGRLHLWRRLQFAGALRKRGYRAAYVISRSLKSALVPFLAGIPERVGWFGEGRLILINRPRFGDLPMPRMVDRIGTLACDPHTRKVWPEPRLVITPAMLADWRKHNGEAQEARLTLAIAPGSSAQYKNWEPELYARLVQWAHAQGHAIWLVGAANESALVARVNELAGGIARAATSASLVESAYRIAAADVFVGNDSGPLHIAAALGKASVGIFTFTQPFVTAPINIGVHAVTTPLHNVWTRRHVTQIPEFEAVSAAVAAAIGEVRSMATG